MSVYTPVKRDQLKHFLQGFLLGQLYSYDGIREGVENTNYFVNTERGEYVLTLFETVPLEDLPYCLELTAHLAGHGLPCARPILNEEGCYLLELCGKPAALVERLAGHSVTEPQAEHCHAVGRLLAHLHQAGRDFSGKRTPSRGPAWWRGITQRLAPRLSKQDRTLLYDELNFQEDHDLDGLPGGVIHSDLFRDNVLFEGDREIRLSGVIDFYYACNWCYLYDLAVTVNDWCPHDPILTEVLLEAYRGEHIVEDDERAAWPVALRAAALRFWLSRLRDRHFPRPGQLTNEKDPDTFKELLQARRKGTDITVIKTRPGIPIFTYGTLMPPEVYRRLIGGQAQPWDAVLYQYRRGLIPDTSHPGLWLVEGAQVSGKLYPPPTKAELARIDEYESDYYQRTLLQVQSRGAKQQAWVYLPTHHAPDPWQDWNPETDDPSPPPDPED